VCHHTGPWAPLVTAALPRSAERLRLRFLGGLINLRRGGGGGGSGERALTGTCVQGVVRPS